MPSRDAQRLFEGALAFFEPVETEERDAFEAMKFRLPLALTRLLLHLQPSLTAARAAVVLALPRQRFGQQAKP